MTRIENREPRTTSHGFLGSRFSVSHKLIERPGLTIGTALLLAFAFALLLAIGWMGAPQQDVNDLMIYLALSSGASLALGIPTIWWGRSGYGKLIVKLTVTYALGVAIAAVNVLLTAGLMFINPHDRSLLLLLLGFAALLALGLGVALATALSANVVRLREGARALAQGDLQVRVRSQGNDELAELSREFNRMAERLAAAEEQRNQAELSRRELMAAISHDLRTPLTSLQALTEALADGVVTDPATTQRYLDRMRGQIGHLSSLIDDLFELAQIESGALKLSLERARLTDLLSDALEGLRVQAEAKGVSLEGEVATEVDPVLMAPQKIERVIYNLLSNAIRHTPADGTVAIEARRVQPEELPAVFRPATPAREPILVAVRDTGEGIDASDLPYVFDRFYRGEKSRSRETGGAGLGLAIARGIIEAHGGQIWVTSEKRCGTTFYFTLMREEARSEN